MTFARSAMAGLLGAAILGGCGGGGGGGGRVADAPVVPPPSASPPPSERVTGGSGPLVVLMDEGKPVSFSVGATAVSAPGLDLRIAVLDSKGVLHSEVTVGNAPGLHEYAAQVATKPTLAPGEHQTTLEVRICYDAPQVCASPVPGSPWQVPLKVKVGAPAGTAPLAVDAGVPSWSTFHGNAAHTASVPASYAHAAFTPRWRLPADGSLRSHVPVHENGRVFFSRRTRSGDWELLAIGEETGQVAWRHAFEPYLYVGPPAAANGKLVFTSNSSIGGSESVFWVLDQATGEVISKAPFASPQTPGHQAPTIAGHMAYTGAGPGEGLAQFSMVTGRLQWTRGGLPRGGYWTPAVDAARAYVFLDKTLYATNVADGSAAFAIGDDDPRAGYGGPEAAVLGGGMAFVGNGLTLGAFDLNTRTKAWSKISDLIGQPALADGVLYVLMRNGTYLEALEPATGNLLWRSLALRAYSEDPFLPFVPFVRVIVGKNVAFVTSWRATVAIDLTTRQAVWIYPLGGDLSISDRGVLYILSTDGTLAAVNLR